MSTFKISGTQRRLLKKEVSSLQSTLRSFWFCHQTDKDMAQIYGSSNDYPMSDADAETRYQEIKQQIAAKQALLNETIDSHEGD